MAGGKDDIAAAPMEADTPMSGRPTRDRKGTEFFQVEDKKVPEKIDIKQGAGTKLGDIPNVAFHISKLNGKDELAKMLHQLLFRKPCKWNLVKQHLREFSGFTYENKEAEREKDKLKMQKFTTAGVAGLLDVFDLPRSVQEGEAKKVPSKDGQIDRILEFLQAPFEREGAKDLQAIEDQEKEKRKAKADKSKAKKEKETAKKEKEAAKKEKELAKKEKELKAKAKSLKSPKKDKDADDEKKKSKSDKELSKKVKELEKKAKELAKLEKQLAQKEREMKSGGKRAALADEAETPKKKAKTSSKKKTKDEDEDEDEEEHEEEADDEEEMDAEDAEDENQEEEPEAEEELEDDAEAKENDDDVGDKNGEEEAEKE